MMLRWVMRDWGPGMVQISGERVTWLVLQVLQNNDWVDVPFDDQTT